MVKYLFLSVVVGFFFGLAGSYMRLNIFELPVTEISNTEVKEFSQASSPSGDSPSLSTKPNDIKQSPTGAGSSNEEKINSITDSSRENKSQNSPNAEELRNVLQELGIDVTEEIDLETLIERFGPLLESQNNLERNPGNGQSPDNVQLTDLIGAEGQMPTPEKIRENLEAMGIEIPANVNIEDFIKDFQPPVGNDIRGGGPSGGGPPNENMLRALLGRAGISVPENASREELIQLMRENGIGRGRR
ncbi:hypothetical protein M1N55_04985 [Dehalococcoidia bacterium]|nr:hypothetical protein [Dehalococcoidia bacterium]